MKRRSRLGYLVGPYDSFHSIHSPDEADTWETAQFDRDVVRNRRDRERGWIEAGGFKQKVTFSVPPRARPCVEHRVAALMPQFRCNSWFVDCDAFGEVFDDYSPHHPATQSEDAAERSRGWRGSATRYRRGDRLGRRLRLRAPAIHFAHGMMTPVIGWGDPDLMKDKSSKYFLGSYYPPDGPAVFFKQVPMKAEYRRDLRRPAFSIASV